VNGARCAQVRPIKTATLTHSETWAAPGFRQPGLTHVSVVSGDVLLPAFITIEEATHVKHTCEAHM
jgi:hypothetical protein